MKKLFYLLIAASMLSMGVCRAQQPTIPQKAEYFAEWIFKVINKTSADSDMDYMQKSMQQIGDEMGAYIASLDEKQGNVFGEKFSEYIYKCSDKYGYGEEFAASFLKSMVEALTEAAEE